MEDVEVFSVVDAMVDSGWLLLPLLVLRRRVENPPAACRRAACRTARGDIPPLVLMPLLTLDSDKRRFLNRPNVWTRCCSKLAMLLQQLLLWLRLIVLTLHPPMSLFELSFGSWSASLDEAFRRREPLMCMLSVGSEPTTTVPEEAPLTVEPPLTPTALPLRTRSELPAREMLFAPRLRESIEVLTELFRLRLTFDVFGLLLVLLLLSLLRSLFGLALLLLLLLFPLVALPAMSTSENEVETDVTEATEITDGTDPLRCASERLVLKEIELLCDLLRDLLLLLVRRSGGREECFPLLRRNDFAGFMEVGGWTLLLLLVVVLLPLTSPLLLLILLFLAVAIIPS